MEQIASNDAIDVCVIGAGLSGLVSARILESKGRKVEVLEANERVGGRLLTGHSPVLHAPVDLGGAYVASKQHRIMHLAKELGVQTYKVHDEGSFVSEGTKGEISRSYPPGKIFERLDFLRACVWIHDASQKIPSTAEGLKVPEELERLDEMSVEAWAEKEMHTQLARQMLLNIVEGIACRKCSELSMLTLLMYVKSSGSFEYMLETYDGAQEMKFVGGSAQITQKIAEQLSSVRLSHVVNKIEQNDDNVVVHCKNGSRFVCKQVIVAVAPPVLKSVEFVPQLSPSKQALVDSMLTGKVVKTIMYYETAFWRKDGLSGAAAFTDLSLPVLVTLDDCSPGGEYFAILGFIFTSSSTWMEVSLEERKAAISQQYARVFKNEKALSPIDYVEKDWREEPFAPGCYGAVIAKGTTSKSIPALRENHGKIVFSGSETATVNPGYMDGAVESGE